MATDKPLIVIVGPTASGKTSLAIEVALKYNGEIICADSRTIYTGMDVGTAKPSSEEQALVPHWGIDLVEPGERFTAADFKEYANNKINEVRSRHKMPILVGGTGLYVDSVVYDFRFSADFDEVKRKQLESMTVEELQEYCKENSVALPENSLNKRYLVRAIERSGLHNTSDYTQPERTYVVGMTTNMSTLRARIVERTEQLFANGVVKESIMLGKKYGWDNEAMTGNIYRLLKNYHGNDCSLDDVKNNFITADYRLAKRQMTWLRRNPNIMWVSRADGFTTIADYLER